MQQSLFKCDNLEVKKVFGLPFVKNFEGEQVAVLPFRFKEGPNGPEPEFLVCIEWVHCWGIELVKENSKPQCMTAIADNLVFGKPTDIAIAGIKTRTGFDINKDQLVELGGIYLTKFSSDMSYLFTVDVTGMQPGEIVKGRSDVEYQWVDEDKMIQLASDPILLAMFSKLIMRWK